jgi:hypothetical protein
MIFNTDSDLFCKSSKLLEVINTLVSSAINKGLDNEFITIEDHEYIVWTTKVPELIPGEHRILLFPIWKKDFCCWFCSIISTFAFYLLDRIQSSKQLLHVCHNNTI